jgi:hypothetical protein
MQRIFSAQLARPLRIADRLQHERRVARAERAQETLRGALPGAGVQHQLREEPAVGDDPVGQLQHQPAQPFARRSRRVRGDLQLREQRRVPAFDQFGDEGIAAAEVVDEGAEVHACAAGHAAHRQCAQTAAARQLQPAAQQSLACGRRSSRCGSAIHAASLYGRISGGKAAIAARRHWRSRLVVRSRRV